MELVELCDSVYENEEVRSVACLGRVNLGSSKQVFSLPGGGLTSATTALSTSNMASRPMVCSANPAVRENAIWKRKQKWWNRLGFYAALYSRASDGKNILAFRGTDELFTDVFIDDAAIALGGIPPQVAAAFEVARAANLSGDDYVTGHSLGGALAIIAAARHGVPAVTFNAPGVMESCMEASVVFPGAVGGIMKALARCIVGARVLNLRIRNDLVSSFFTTGAQPGKRIELSTSQCSAFNAKCRHGIKTCIEEVKKRSDACDELKL